MLSAGVEASQLKSLRSIMNINQSMISALSLTKLSRATRGENSFLSDYISPMKAQIAQAELLLEAYFQSFDSMFHKLQVGSFMYFSK